METQKMITRLTSSISFKLILIGIISLLLLIPASWIRSVIVERETRNMDVKNEMSVIWGGGQSIAGPVITIPFKVLNQSGEEKTTVIRQAHFFPEILEAEVKLFPEERYRGIFKVVVFESEILLQGEFDYIKFEDFKVDPVQILWDQATIQFFIPENKSIRSNPTLIFNDQELEIIPGTEMPEILNGGFHAFVPIHSEQGNSKFKIKLNLAGTESFSVYPTARQTKAVISGNWVNPSFRGSMLPSRRNISENNFNAEWATSYLNRNYPQQWLDENISLLNSDFGVELISPVDHYQKSLRSVKYSLMFIVLTFMVFILIELLNKNRMHPIQYFMTGFALVIFYILLVSLSEQIGFNLAYLVSAISIVSLISYYTWASFKKFKITLISIGLLSVLYTFLFVILQLQDYALLFGAIGIFIALATFMILTRNYSWYREE